MDTSKPLHERHTILYAILENTQDMIASRNSEGKLLFYNTASANLIETIENLSEIAVLRNESELTLLPINLYDTVYKTIQSVAALADNSKVRIINEVQENDTVLAIPAYLDSIVLNFMTNAIKYAAPTRESYVKISTQARDNYLIMCIEDNGVGIDLARNRHKLFGMYKTFHSHPEAKGIGLFITKNQVESIGGHIEVASELDKGTTFSVYFRKAL